MEFQSTLPSVRRTSEETSSHVLQIADHSKRKDSYVAKIA